MLERYQLSEKIPFAAHLVDMNGAPISGSEVVVTVLDFDNLGTIVLNEVAMAESVQDGYYVFDWTHGFSVPKRLLATIKEIAGNKETVIDVKKIYIDDFKIYLTDKIDENDGQAV